MSNLPAVIPVVGNIVTASADLFVLTKNQMLLVFKLAAARRGDPEQPQGAHGANPGRRRQLLLALAGP